MPTENFTQFWTELEDLFDQARLSDIEKILEDIKNTWETMQDKSFWYYYKGRLYLEKGSLEESISALIEAKKYIEAISDLLINKIDIQLGISLCRQGNFKSAMNLLTSTAKDLENSPHISLYSLALNWIGNIYWLSGDLKNALIYHKKNLEIRETNTDMNAIASTLNNIGIIYRAQGRLREAQSICERALNVTVPNLRVKAFLYTNFGILNYEQSDFENALKRHYLALDIREQLKNPADIADSVFNIARTLASTNSFSADHIILDHFPKEKDFSPVIDALQHLINALLAVFNNNWQLAEEHWRYALSIKGLEYGYQIICYEGLVETALRDWQNSDTYATFNLLLTRLEDWEHMCIKNNLTASLCKVYLIFAKISLAKLQLDDANKFLEKGFQLSSDMGLPLHQQLLLKELIEIESIKERISKLYNLTQEDFFEVKVQEATVYVKELSKVLADLDDK